MAGTAELSEPVRYRELQAPWRMVTVVLTLGAILLAVNQLFNLQLFGIVILDTRYLYALAGVFLAITFLTFPAYSGAPLARTPWYDIALALLSAATSGYFVWTAERSLLEGWEYAAPESAMWASVVLWLLILEATRRTGGWVIFAIVLFFSLYPTFADLVPGPISGFAQPLPDTLVFHILSSESSFGIPMRAFGELVIGFIVFGATLQHTGGGRFFNDLALSLVGGFRGGAAKVAIFASGFMGSMSGSVISNVLTTGAVSIPAMKRTGFSAPYAAGTEACASTGGVLMPPVMGTTAFVMASFLGLPYIEVAAAAAIPSVLYYFGLFVQIDAYAARRDLQGMAREELPSLKETCAQGWQYLLVFAVLIFIMIGLRQETLAPFYATGLLLVINQLSRATRLDWPGLMTLAEGVGRSLCELVALLLGVGLIVGAFSATGLAGTLVNDLIFLAGDAPIVLLVMGAVTSFIFGMGMTVTACYIFLAVVLAPALTQTGMNQVAVHLFIMYWGMVSYITPPVALGAFTAATLARTSPMRSGLAAMRLGSVIYLVPFFFVLNPALIGQGSLAEMAVLVVTALFGVYLIGSALQGYAAGFGAFGSTPLGLALRVLLFASGLVFAAPGNAGLGLTHLHLALIGAALAAPCLAYARLQRRQSVAA
ncbi:TRAP transporter fused permease subunit [Kaustia mangrovi]|uniref:TRAP transporter fused permease subunit n=1 Tax=Kaustia mangrovi TaxID=2593653 RepID=A0A7S8HBR7_9HYPH|nr:TRAP transporter fused permease subunit [Kaustia mangrovi]QPC42855.1 TRAP transporter fused permease subunit [Kaustia mangrovi]